MKALAEEHLAHLASRGLAVKTCKRCGYLLNRFLAWFSRDLRETAEKDLREYVLLLEQGLWGRPLKPSSVRLTVSVLKGFFTWLYMTERILVNPAEGLVLAKSGNRFLKKVFTESEMALFLDGIILESPEDKRDRALFELLYSSALRAGEVLNLLLAHLRLEERVLLVCRGKGGRDRYVPFSKTARRYLVLYLKEGRKHLAPCSSSRVFPLSYPVLRRRFLYHLEESGLAGRGFTIHSIRHAAGTHLLSRGASIRYVQELLGHSDLKTTQLYTHPDAENIRAVYRTYHPRENEYHEEMTEEYLSEVKKLKERLILGRKRSEWYRMRKKS